MTAVSIQAASRRTACARAWSLLQRGLRTLGYDTKEQITGHGFRATARTLIRELLGWDREVIERHLAHVSDEELGGSYDRTTHFNQRCRMIQLWADLLDDLAAGKVVAPTNDMRRSGPMPPQSWTGGDPAPGVGNEDGFRVAA